MTSEERELVSKYQFWNEATDKSENKSDDYPGCSACGACGIGGCGGSGCSGSD